MSVWLLLFGNPENLCKCSACKLFDIFTLDFMVFNWLLTQMSNQPIAWLLVPPNLLWVFQKLLIYWDLKHLQGWGFNCSIKNWIVIVCLLLCCKCGSPTLGIQFTLKWTVNPVQMYLLASLWYMMDPKLLLMQLSYHENKSRNSQCCLGVLAAWMMVHQRNKNEQLLFSQG